MIGLLDVVIAKEGRVQDYFHGGQLGKAEQVTSEHGTA